MYNQLENNFKNIVDSVCNLCVRSVLVSIPGIGPILDVVYTEGNQYRRDLFMSELINNIDLSKVDKEYLYSIEFRNFLFKTVKLLLEEVNEDKIKFYSKLVKNSLESDNYERKYYFDYLKIINELSISQMQILHEIYNQQKDLYKHKKEHPEYLELTLVNKFTDWKNLPEILYKKYGIDKDDLNFLLKRTESTGLIHEIIGSYIEYPGGTFIMNATLRKFMHSLDIID